MLAGAYYGSHQAVKQQPVKQQQRPSVVEQQLSVEQQRFDEEMVEKCAEYARQFKANSHGLIQASAGHWNRSKHTCYMW
jgi:hypothetical protein